MRNRGFSWDAFACCSLFRNLYFRTVVWWNLLKTPMLISKSTMIAFLASMCIALPIALLPLMVLNKISILKKAISDSRRQTMALNIGEVCTRTLLRIFPFVTIRMLSTPPNLEKDLTKSEPTIWVCNHTSMLDVFILLAVDTKLRGRSNCRPIKAIYVSTYKLYDRSLCVSISMS